MNVRLALTTTKKGNMLITDYVAKMKGFADEMAAVGKSLDDEELVAHICNGLDAEYNSVVTSITARTDSISIPEFYAQLLSFETRLELQDGGSYAHVANRGRGSSNRGLGNARGRGQRGRGQMRGRGGGAPKQHNGGRQPGPDASGFDDVPLCQIYFKTGHKATKCWHRFDENYVPEERHVNAAITMNAYNVDTNWYTDTGAMDHVTSDLNKLTMREKYHGNDQIHTASGSGMEIKHVGHTTVPTQFGSLQLNNVLHVPKAAKNLVSVHRLAKDNYAFIEFHPDFFLIKDQATRKTILEGPCRRGLYPLPTDPPVKQANAVDKPIVSRWHNRLGHPSLPIVTKVIDSNNLSCSSVSNKTSVCDACQQEKAISYLIVDLLVQPVFLWNLFIQMFGVVQLNLLAGNAIMLALWMTSVALRGFIFLSINLKFSKSSMNSKNWLSDNLMERFLLCKPIGAGNIKN